jgi:hypothetical protein
MSNQPNPNAFFRSEDIGTGNFPINNQVYVPMSIGLGTVFMNQPVNVSFTLRDYFAAAALQGILADGDGRCRADDAKNAFKAADAMLKARESK